MPKLIIDQRPIEVPAGLKVIEAAERLGIMIPRFCYHPALGSVGACRMCAVKFLEGPLKGIQMSCTADAQDGMVVSTVDSEAVEFRRYIIELLMLNHPHDCPVCDEGGQCLLQDETVSGGHGLRRFLGRKRTYHDQVLGEFIAHEMNRCIHCYRCARFYQEFSGYRDLGPLQTANRVYFGRFQDGKLESPFSGNLVDLCPTGVFTDKPARYRGRRWDFQRGPSLCLGCSLGCNTIASVRYRSVVRIEARFKEAVNGWFICDRGRFGFDSVNHVDRPRRARMGCTEASFAEALAEVARKLKEIKTKNGPRSVAWLGSSRCSLETQGALVRLCRETGGSSPVFFPNRTQERKARMAAVQLDEQLAVSLGGISSADFLLVVGADPINEGPMLALAMRQAFRNEAAVAVLDPRAVELPMEFDHVALPVDRLGDWLRGLVDWVSGEPLDEIPPSPPLTKGGEAGGAGGEQFLSLAEHLRQSRNPVIICGTDIVDEATPDLAADLASSLLRRKGKAGLCYLLPGPNTFGAALLSGPGENSFEEVLEDIEQGRVRALVLVKEDPYAHFPDRPRLDRAFARLELLAVLDHLPSEAARRAHILLPTSTHYETGSTFINQEGRAQFAPPVFGGGMPVNQVSDGNHPPRRYSDVLPGGEPMAAWQLLARLSQALVGSRWGEDASELSEWLVRECPALGGLRGHAYPWDDVRCLPGKGGEDRVASSEHAGATG
jgi:NADH-quinone oxidoreductase subunit G